MRKFFKNTFFVSFTALISRILGVLRDVLIATMFGANIFSDIFFLCFRIPDFFRKMFSEGILSSSFIPVFSRYHEKQGKIKAFEMANSALILISLLTTIITVFGIVFAPLIIGFFIPEFSSNSYEFNLSVLLSRIMMPYFIFISLLAVCMGILNSIQSFTSPAFAPVIFNIVIIFFALNICKYFNPSVIGLALGVTTGGFVQLLLQVPFLIKKKIFQITKMQLIHSGVIEFIKKFFPAVIGASSFYFNLLVASFFASSLEIGSVSCLYYADRLVQLPMALFSTSLAIVFLPLFSKKAILKDRNESIFILLKGLKMLFFIIIPAMAGLIILREPIVRLFFYHGAFDLIAVQKTSSFLLFLVFGLWAYSGTRILVSFFHAYSDMKTPFIAGITAIIANFILSIILIEVFGLKGISIAISIAGAVNFFILFIRLNFVFQFSYKDIVFSACRAVFVSGIMYFSIKLLILQINKNFSFEMPDSISIAISVVIGVLVYFAVNIIINSSEIKMIKNEIFKTSITNSKDLRIKD